MTTKVKRGDPLGSHHTYEKPAVVTAFFGAILEPEYGPSYYLKKGTIVDIRYNATHSYTRVWFEKEGKLLIGLVLKSKIELVEE